MQYDFVPRAAEDAEAAIPARVYNEHTVSWPCQLTSTSPSFWNPLTRGTGIARTRSYRVLLQQTSTP